MLIGVGLSFMDNGENCYEEIDIQHHSRDGLCVPCWLLIDKHCQ